jgi:hypothetical protein
MFQTFDRKPDHSQQLRRLLSLILSALLHSAIAGILFFLPPFPGGTRNRDRTRSAVRLQTAPKERKIIWLRRKERLPSISPTAQRAGDGARRKKMEGPNKLFVRTDPPNAKHWDQFVFVPRPKAEEQKPIPSPDVVVTAPAVPVPPKPEPRKFVLPPDRPKPAKPGEMELQEPAIANQTGLGPDVKAPTGLTRMDAPKPAGRKFVPPPEPKRQVTARAIDMPEGLPIQTTDLSAIKPVIRVGQPDAPKPPGRKFVAPDALAGGKGLGGARGGGSAGSAVAEPDLASIPLQGGMPGDVSAVIISAVPSANATIIPPDGNRESRINSGSLPGGQGRPTPGSAGGDGLVVPGVTVRGGTPDSAGGATAANRLPPRPPAPSAATPTSIPSIRPRLNTPSVSVPQRPNARRVPPQVEGVFQNRVVYCTAMPGPSGTSDWVVWFGETEATPAGSRVVMRPPVAGKTALPAGKPGGSAEARFWIAARLGKNGRLTAVRITGGPGAQQALELMSEMDRWVFTPAIRNGEAVDVDLVLEARLSGPGM